MRPKNAVVFVGVNKKIREPVGSRIFDEPMSDSRLRLLGHLVLTKAQGENGAKQRQ